MKNKIESLIKEAMKKGDTITRDVLRVLKGDIERNEQGKNGKIVVSDLEIVRMTKKMIENISAIDSNSPELPVLESLLPVQMTNDQINDELNLVTSENEPLTQKDMGRIMKHFKDHFEGRYDGKTLTQLFKLKAI